MEMIWCSSQNIPFMLEWCALHTEKIGEETYFDVFDYQVASV